jgi:sarcosine oxidase
MNTRNYDVVVVGLAGLGSATLYQLARRGLHVLGLSAKLPGHSSRIRLNRCQPIRETGVEFPGYLPFVERAYSLWRELEAVSGQSLLKITGGLAIDRPYSKLITNLKASATHHNFLIEQMQPAEVTSHFPQFCLSEEQVAIYEPNAGIILAEECIAAQLNLAHQYQAQIPTEEWLVSWESSGRGVQVSTNKATYIADKLVFWLLNQAELPKIGPK